MRPVDPYQFYQAGDGELLLDRARAQNASNPADQVADVASAAAGFGYNPFNKEGREAIRFAAQKPLGAMGLLKPDGAVRWGRGALGVGSILTLLSAANELNDPTESSGRNLAQAGGTAVGGIGGTAAGGFLGGLLTGGNPVGILVGSALGNALGGTSGKGLASFAADLVEGSPTDQALRAARDQARMGMQLEAERMKTLLPVQDMAAKVALQNEVNRAKALTALQNDAQLRQNMAQAFLMQQQAGAQQQLATTQAVLGGMG